MTERERHDFTASELTDLRGLHEAVLRALRAADAAIAQSIRIQQQAQAAIARALGEAAGRPRVAPPRRGTCLIEPTQPHEFDRDACTAWVPLDPSPSESQIEAGSKFGVIR